MYIQEICKDISNFMPAYTENRASLHHCVPHGNQVYPKLVATTWLLTFDIIQSRNPGAVRLLQLFALLNPDGIHLDFLRAGSSGLTRVLRDLVRDEAKSNEALFLLEQFLLIKHLNCMDLITVHRLVQSVMRDELITNRFRLHLKNEPKRRIQAMWIMFSRVSIRVLPGSSNYNFTYEMRVQCQSFQDQIVGSLRTCLEFTSYSIANLLMKVGLFLLDNHKFNDAKFVFKKLERILKGRR